MCIFRVTKKLALSATIAFAWCGLGTISASAADGIEVIMHQAKIVRLTRPADTIVVGNPDIVDAAVQDPTTIVLTGKGFGVTNLVILDKDGEPIVDEAMFVSRDTTKSLRIYRRAEVDRLSCTPYCETAYQAMPSSGGTTQTALPGQ